MGNEEQIRFSMYSDPRLSADFPVRDPKISASTDGLPCYSMSGHTQMTTLL